uniref:NIPSNAP domain-containing protein n=1 Tax=Haptolina brevifila TaxID=156173 RepID=A0A7S2GUU0_9EUKA|mmetsp:Transcript_47430/g.94660  ORF Transcript_47430/g.94660 Transcript_47430/m.94660 type:complete len:251 (+) Transcript_47430:2-754(+)
MAMLKRTFAAMPPLRGLARRAFSARADGFFELRQDCVMPDETADYMHQHTADAEERRRLFPGWCGSWKTELGGELSEVHSLYHWHNYTERDAAHKEAHAVNWADNGYSAAIFVEATECLNAAGLTGASGFVSPPYNASSDKVAWELRTYQLVLGYSTVPSFLRLYSEGLCDKLAADDTGASTLVTLLYSDNGPLNVVHEIWRHESMQRAQDSRVASRKAVKWRSAVEQIAQLSTSFETRYILPLSGAPWQ